MSDEEENEETEETEEVSEAEDETEAEPLGENQADISAVLKESFGTYAKYVICNRAVPDVRDGLKPVHRRLIYTAFMIPCRARSQHVKSAKVTGQCMADYHPHGDAYGTMVRMAQPWAMRIPLFDGQGNFGSRDNDPPAANRYCLPSGTPILLSDGNSRAVEELQVGDMVLTHRGVAQPVERLLPMEHPELIRIELETGFVFHASPNHPLLVERDERWCWVRCGQLLESDRLARLISRGEGLTDVEDVDPTLLKDKDEVCSALRAVAV